MRVVTSAGAIIKTPLPGGGKANPACAAFKTAESNLEDPQSVSVYVTYGKFRTYHSGDLPKGKEFELMCPTTKIGPVDVLLGLHHGVATSNSPVLVHALHPRVAIMNNGTRKGGDPDVMESVHTSPGLEDLWQMHFSTLSGQENTTVPGIVHREYGRRPTLHHAHRRRPRADSGTRWPPPPPAHNGKAYWIKVSAQLNGSFTVTNTRNGFTKTY